MLVCPDCRSDLSGAVLTCSGCGVVWPRSGPFQKLHHEADVRGTDRFMRRIYNGLPALHDPLTRHLLPILQQGGSEAQMRSDTLARMSLDELSSPTGEPVRILEVGVGSGANLDLLRKSVPREIPMHVWGLDLAAGMLKHAARRLPIDGLDVDLVIGDAHRLPFPDHVFDRVFHIGALGSFRDPAAALAEMGRVAKPGTPVVVVDEQLDQGSHNGLRARLAFRLLTFYDTDPHAPVEALPGGATDVQVDQISRFYYCMRFVMAPTP